MNPGNYQAACEAIDQANANDPSKRESSYSQRMVEWVRKLAPGASPELLLAARAQHVRRWTLPRGEYPAGRAGYLQWREHLKRFHADTLAGIMKEAGYGAASIQKARQILVRKNLAPDPEGQSLEDAACLVFLEFEFAEFANKTPDDTMIGILKKTWQKMSPPAREAAGNIKVDEKGRALLKQALG